MPKTINSKHVNKSNVAVKEYMSNYKPRSDIGKLLTNYNQYYVRNNLKC